MIVCIDVCIVLLKRKANVNEQLVVGEATLFEAAQNGHADV